MATLNSEPPGLLRDNAQLEGLITQSLAVPSGRIRDSRGRAAQAVTS